MTKLYKKSEITFAVLWIVVYVILTGFADTVSKSIGVIKSATALLHIVMTFILFFWIKKNELCSKYGLCKTKVPAKKFLFYLPLAVIASTALWNGVGAKYGFTETLLYIVSMCCVGFLEEVIFRGLLFRAMLKDDPKEAMAVSALTFGLGHIVNLFNGSGQALAETLTQMVFAVVVGFILVLIFYYGGSLLPCILFHAANNALNAFALASHRSRFAEIAIDIALIVVLSGGYLLYLVNAFQKKPEASPTMSGSEK